LTAVALKLTTAPQGWLPSMLTNSEFVVAVKHLPDRLSSADMYNAQRTSSSKPCPTPTATPTFFQIK